MDDSNLRKLIREQIETLMTENIEEASDSDDTTEEVLEVMIGDSDVSV